MGTIGWQRLEGACVGISALMLFAFSGDAVAWWLAVVLFFAPDISFAGYLAGPRVGAVAYNLVHVYAFGTVLLAVGIGMGAPVLASLGALWIAHSGFDRMLGYGLKSPEGFTVTHLGTIGR
ncbi:MAG: DUF4260 domain-containing protein [Azospirillaceae bacterium]